MSVYLKTLGLGYEPKSLLDAERVGELLKACGDLGRLGGLLKLWLSERPGDGAPDRGCAGAPAFDRGAARPDRGQGGGGLIAKASRRVAGGSFGRLAAYVSDLKKIGDLRDWKRTADYILDKKGGGERVEAIRVTNCANEEPGLALAEIANTQERNTTSKTDKTYHLIVSFPPGETADARPSSTTSRTRYARRSAWRTISAFPRSTTTRIIFTSTSPSTKSIRRASGR